MNKQKKVLDIKLLDISIRTKNVLTALDIKTVDELHLSYLFGTLPLIGTKITHYPYANVKLEYDNKVNQEVRALLLEHCNVPIEKLHAIGT